jgi:hypothetical protein
MPAIRLHRVQSAHTSILVLLIITAGECRGAGPATQGPKIDVARNDEARWFPTQTLPRALVRTDPDERHARPLGVQMMLQSVAGLAAGAVNNGRAEEVVWVASGNADVERWGAQLLERTPSIRRRGVFQAWDLVDRYRDRGLIKGYILYRLDQSPGNLNEHRVKMDLSVNVATSLAGLLDGIIIEEGLEAQASAHGLKLLVDVRNKTQKWCFETYKARFNPRLLCTQDPQKPHVRDLAVAHRAFALYGDDETALEAMKWLEPLSPIVGWNGGDEFRTTRTSSVYGHLQTATDWCMNLPVLMAGSERSEPPEVKGFDPREIDWGDQRSTVSFVSSDGDNVQWLEGNFFGDPSFWANPDRGRIPFGWSTCFAHLAQLCPPAVSHAAKTHSRNDHFLEWGGGYYYPDLFAQERPERWALLARHARQTWAWMRRNHTPVIGFNVSEPDSPAARKAFEVFAGQTDGLLAILVFKYSPYEGGEGKIFWVKDRRGVDIPVITARYSIWEHSNSRPRSGTPAKVAREIRETVARSPRDQLPRHDWVIVHVWSYFRRAPGPDEEAENIPQEAAATGGGLRGYAPALWCAERLQGDVRVVPPEELIWRIRMKHDPEQTRAILRATRR